MQGSRQPSKSLLQGCLVSWHNFNALCGRFVDRLRLFEFNFFPHAPKSFENAIQKPGRFQTIAQIGEFGQYRILVTGQLLRN
jgi:hypothetical protein